MSDMNYLTYALLLPVEHRPRTTHVVYVCKDNKHHILQQLLCMYLFIYLLNSGNYEAGLVTRKLVRKTRDMQNEIKHKRLHPRTIISENIYPHVDFLSNLCPLF